MRMNDEAFLESRQRARMKHEAKYLNKIERREDEAEALIGELQNEKGIRYYINVLTKNGQMTGKIKEFTRKGEAIHYLVRNNYV